MFYVEDGQILYNGDRAADNLFGTDVIVEDAAAVPVETTPPVAQDDASDLLDTVSGSDAVSGNNITYHVNVFAAPATSPGIPNSQSLSYLEDVVAGYPSYYKYVAYRTSTDYSQAMVLYVARKAELTGNTVLMQDVDVIQLVYDRGAGSYNARYYREYQHRDTESVVLSDNAFVYTNVTDGYAQFDAAADAALSSHLLVAAMLGALISFVLNRLLGGTRHD